MVAILSILPAVKSEGDLMMEKRIDEDVTKIDIKIQKLQQEVSEF